jgi:hypothetical protein
MAAAKGADRDDEAARSALAWYDFGAVVILDGLPPGRPAGQQITAAERRPGDTPGAARQIRPELSYRGRVVRS